MSAGQDFLFGNAGRNATDSAALENLASTVSRLLRAERRQTLAHYSYAGLFWGLVLAAFAVLAIRLGLLSLTVAQVTLICIVAALAAGLAIRAAKRRPALAVAIVADIRLGLKQQLSSAWELYEQDNRSTIAASISRQLPMTRAPDAQRVFPLSGRSGNAAHVHGGIRWGRLVPAAGLLLLLLSTLDFNHITNNNNQIDTAVQREGTVLRNYGNSLTLRARDNKLKASTEVADAMVSLGRRMESGSLQRATALQQLTDLRRDIGDSRRQLTSPGNHADNTRRTGENNSQRARERALDTIERAADAMTRGEVAPEQLRDDTSLQRALVTADVNPEAFRKALEDAHNGDPESLQQILQDLRADEQATRDAEELDRASERLQRIRENLGAQTEPQTSAQSAGTRDTESLNGDNASGRDFFDQAPDADSDLSSYVFGDEGRSDGRRPDSDSTASPAPTVTEKDQRPVQLKGKVTEGRELTTQTRVAPKANEATIPLQLTNAEQRRQLEAIMSKETLPAHQKDYVRRYFIELNRAAGASPAEPPK